MRASMARHDARARRGRRTLPRVSDPPRPHAPLSFRLVGIVVLAVLAWLLFGSALSVARAVIALAGYVIVAVVAYLLGRWVGSHSAPR